MKLHQKCILCQVIYTKKSWKFEKLFICYFKPITEETTQKKDSKKK